MYRNSYMDKYLDTQTHIFVDTQDWVDCRNKKPVRCGVIVTSQIVTSVAER